MFRFVATMSLLQLLVACGPPVSSGGGGGGGGGRGGSECVSHSECELGQRCDNGFCITANDCANDNDCGAGQICTDGACEDGGSSCADIRDCPAGQVCDANRCVPQGTACQGDNDCERGEVCNAGRCAPGDGSCTGDNDCAVGQSCVNGRCLTTGGGDDCIRNSDCPNGQICDNNRCINEGSCTSDRDCGLGEACQGGQCVQAGGAACRTHSQCTGTQVCVVPQGANAGTCQDLLGISCRSDNDCDIDDTDGRGTGGVCNAGRCRVGEFFACTRDGQCGSGLSCITAGQNQLCLKRCQDNSVCGATTICEQQINACWYNLCGAPNELSAGFQNVNNGRLGGSCNADGNGDGTCVEVSAGDNEWVGLCIEGGTANLGAPCLFEAQRSDNRNQCVGGALCHYNNDRQRGVCVSSCAPAGSHGSVRCPGGSTCMAGRCISPQQTCDPGSTDTCGLTGTCALVDWETNDGFCIVQEMNTMGVGDACESSSQCVDGSVCLNLGDGDRCTALCRPAGGGQACAGGTTCRSLPSLSNNQIGGDWGLCVAG